MQGAERSLLLLRCRLGETVQPLSQREYDQLFTVLREYGPVPDPEREIDEEVLCGLGFSPELAQRISRLLSRPKQPEEYLEPVPDVSVLTRISPAFPRKLGVLGGECPAALFCRGDVSLFQEPCVSLVGSRLLFERGKRFAQRIGRMAAEEGYVLVSGNAPGADRAAQEACLEAGGRVIAFVPDALGDCPVTKNVLYVSDEGHDCSFTSGRALRRNHYIHAMGDKTFVAQCPKPFGGTWSGAEYNLRRGLSGVYVLNDGSEGALALGELGAVLLEDEPASIAELRPSQLSIFD
ncbi:MAG: DNA-processing protein DprA [Oscillospiraceae bacterium]|nr:DNA-processing protein DprA [Oscillospiraceae bacterium]